MNPLPDPRQFKPFSTNALVALAETLHLADSAPQQGTIAAALGQAMESALDRGDDVLVAEALGQATSAAVRRDLHVALSRAIDAPAGATSMQVRLFAIPLLVVAGGRGEAVIPGVLGDVSALAEVFALHGALGGIQNFALGPALASFDTLAAIPPSELYRLSRATGAIAPLDLPPSDIVVTGSAEQVHLRFLAGVAATTAEAPGFAETAGNIAAWGMPFTRAIAGQLAQPGLSVLPIPRPPMGLPRALWAGAFALRELRFQLFLSSALREFRASVGEPDVAIEAAAGGLRVLLHSPFDEALRREHAWPLEPWDEMAEVSKSILGLLAECRVERIDIAAPARGPAGSH